MDYRFAVLGPIRAWRDGVELDLGPARQRCVFAVLVLRGGRALSLTQLIDAVWGDTAPRTAPAAVHTYISRLRKILGPDAVAQARGGYRLAVNHWDVDATDFAALVSGAREAKGGGDPAGAARGYEAAVRMWDGPPLAGLAGPMVDAERTRLTSRYLDAVEEWADVSLELGCHDRLVDRLRRHLADHPLRERLWAPLLVALYRCGRQGEALLAYEEARRAFIEALGTEPGPHLRRLHARILTEDAGLSGAPPSGPVPGQLPGDIADFRGRATELATLRPLLRAVGVGPALCLISGPAGIGKTALAVRAAHEVRRAFPDGQFYVDLRGADPQPADPGDVLASFLRALGIPTDRLPHPVEERSALYRSLLAADRRVLVVLDNAAGVTQVSPLLPGTPGCAVLITSRDAMPTLPGVHRLRLAVLGEAEAVDVLRLVASLESTMEYGDTADVARLCGYLPLALRIAGARARDLPGRPMAELARRLAGKGRLRELELHDLSVPASFELSYRILPSGAARAFRLLGLVEGPDVDASAVAALLGAAWSSTVDRLAQAHLLEQHHPGRYRMHDLVRLYARERAETEESDEDRSAAIDRLLDAYLSAGRPAADVVAGSSGGPDRAEAFAWFGAERANLLAAMRCTGGSWLLAARLARAVKWLFRSYGHSDEWARVNERFATLARDAGELVLAADFLEELGWLCEDRGDVPGLRRNAEESILVRRAAGDPEGETRALVNLGVAHHRQQALPEATSYYRRALDVARRQGFRRAEAYALANLAAASRDAGDHDAAVDHVTGALAICRADGDVHSEASFMDDLALTHRAAGRFAEAVMAHESAIALCRDVSYRPGEGAALRELGETHLAAGDPARAVTALTAALDLLVDAGNHRGRGRALWQLGLAHRELGDTGAARRCWLEAVAVLAELDAPEAGEVRALLAGP